MLKLKTSPNIGRFSLLPQIYNGCNETAAINNATQIFPFKMKEKTNRTPARKSGVKLCVKRPVLLTGTSSRPPADQQPDQQPVNMRISTKYKIATPL